MTTFMEALDTTQTSLIERVRRFNDDNCGVLSTGERAAYDVVSALESLDWELRRMDAVDLRAIVSALAVLAVDSETEAEAAREWIESLKSRSTN